MFDFLKKKNDKPGEKTAREIDKQYAKNEKARRSVEARQRQISECRAVLEECRFSFQKSIMVENSRAAEMRQKGFATNTQRARVREAAIGILVVDQALFELKSITSESELNSAMNKMGMALKQLQRLDNSTNAISGSSKKILMKWYPYPLEENEADRAANAQLVVPDELRERIDDDFVKNLMNGDSFELCMMKSTKSAEQRTVTRGNYDGIMDNINTLLPDEDERQAERQAMAEKFGDRF